MRQTRQRRDRKEKSMEWGDKSERKGAKLLEHSNSIDYKDSELLRKFMTERGKIMPRRLTGVTAKQQRRIQSAVRRARVMGLVL